MGCVSSALLILAHVAHQIELLFVVLEVVAALLCCPSLELFRDFVEVFAIMTKAHDEYFLLSLGPLICV